MYKNLFTQTTYGKVKSILSKDCQNITDNDVETCLTLTRRGVEEKYGTMHDDEFKELIDYTYLFKDHYKSLTQKEWNTSESSNDRKEEIVVIRDMQKQGHVIPKIILNEVTKSHTLL